MPPRFGIAPECAAGLQDPIRRPTDRWRTGGGLPTPVGPALSPHPGRNRSGPSRDHRGRGTSLAVAPTTFLTPTRRPIWHAHRCRVIVLYRRTVLDRGASTEA